MNRLEDKAMTTESDLAMSTLLQPPNPSGAVHTDVNSRRPFDQPLTCILGLPFDAISLQSAVEQVREAAFSGRRCFLSTPNLNFAIAAQTDADFRTSVLRSDLILVDGMPLVWIGRLLRQRVPARVSGADLFEALQSHSGPPISVFLFGGRPGAAALACENINRRGGGIACVGFDAAGYGSIDSMSSEDRIARVNESGAHFIVVALGAKRGQAWIEFNARRLTAPVLSHLGAVVDFAAGSISRAPRMIQSLGFEWLWRIKEEPGLWSRYWKDGRTALGLILSRVIPDAIATRALPRRMDAPRLSVAEQPHSTTLSLGGGWNDNAVLLRTALDGIVVRPRLLVINLSEVSHANGAFVAVLLLARGRFGGTGTFRIVGANKAVGRSLRLKLAEHLLDS